MHFSFTNLFHRQVHSAKKTKLDWLLIYIAVAKTPTKEKPGAYMQEKSSRAIISLQSKFVDSSLAVQTLLNKSVQKKTKKRKNNCQMPIMHAFNTFQVNVNLALFQLGILSCSQRALCMYVRGSATLLPQCSKIHFGRM